MELTIIIAIAIVAIAIGFIGVPLATKKGWINQESTQASKQILEIISILLQNINLNDGTKENVQIVFGVCEKVVQYVEQISVNDNNEVKKALAVKLTIGLLEQMKIDLTPENKALIEIGIESAVNALPKTTKTTLLSK